MFIIAFPSWYIAALAILADLSLFNTIILYVAFLSVLFFLTLFQSAVLSKLPIIEFFPSSTLIKSVLKLTSYYSNMKAFISSNVAILCAVSASFIKSNAKYFTSLASNPSTDISLLNPLYGAVSTASPDTFPVPVIVSGVAPVTATATLATNLVIGPLLLIVVLAALTIKLPICAPLTTSKSASLKTIKFGIFPPKVIAPAASTVTLPTCQQSYC